jgi:hypothetical protein
MIELTMKFKIDTGKPDADRQVADKFKEEFFGQWDKKMGDAAHFIRPEIVGEEEKPR